MGGAGVGGHMVLLSRSFTRVSSEVACGAWLVIHEPHTSINPEFVWIPARSRAVAVLRLCRECEGRDWVMQILGGGCLLSGRRCSHP